MLSLAPMLLLSLSATLQEAELLTLDRKKVDLATIVVSPDLSRVAYVSADRRYVTVDRQRTGPFLQVAPVAFSADSKSYAFVAQRVRELGSELYIDGRYVQRPHSVSKVVRYGGGSSFAWFEQSKEGYMFTFDGGQSLKMPKVLRTSLAPDGSSYGFIFSEVPKQLEKHTPDFLVTSLSPQVPRGSVARHYMAPKGVNMLTTSVDRNPSVVGWNSQVFSIPGEPKSDPIFSDSGQSYAIRTEFNGITDDKVETRTAYLVNGKLIQDLELQYHLQFKPGTEKFALGGKRGEQFFLKRNFEVSKPYKEIEGFETAPNESVRALVWVENRLLGLFQSKRTKPVVCLEGVGSFPIDADQVFPGSFSVSPDGKHVAFFATRRGLDVPFVLRADQNGGTSLVGNEDFGVSGAADSSPIWVDNLTIRFHGLRKMKLIKIEAKISE